MYKTASGQHIHDEGAVKLKAQDESGNMRGLKGRLTDVHKPLVSASESAKAGQNSWLTKGGGYMVPQSSGVSKKIEKMLDYESRKRSSKPLPVYEAGGVYNFYLKMDKDSSIAPLEEKPEKLEDLKKEQLIKMIQELKKGSQGFTGSSKRKPAQRPRCCVRWCSWPGGSGRGQRTRHRKSSRRDGGEPRGSSSDRHGARR